MKSTRILSVIIATLMLASCGQKAVEVTDAYWTSPVRITSGSGLYFYDTIGDGSTPLLTYIDYNSLVKAVVCPKPNCRHDDKESCFALEFNFSPAVIPIGDKIYWFENDVEFDDGKWTVKSTLMTAGKYGSDKKSVAALKGMNAMADALLVYDGKLWFIAKDVGLDRYGTTDEDYPYIYYYDFSTRKFKEVCNLSKNELGNDPGYATILGFFDGGIIIDVISYKDESKRFQGKFDPQSGKIEKYDFFVSAVYGDYLVGNGEDLSTAVVLSADDQKYTFENLGEYGAFSVQVMNNKLFCSVPKIVIDLQTGKRYRLLKDGVTECVTEYINGEYIIRVNKYDGNGTNFEKLGESSVIGEEIVEVE